MRFKLPLAFAVLGAVAFGLGAYVVTTARGALESQIDLRLEDRAASLRLVVDKSFEQLGGRAQDFASDGHIRLELARLQTSGDPGEGVRGASELLRHLRANKLALAPELTDAYLVDTAGRTLLRARSESGAAPPGFDREGLWYGPLTAPTPEHPYPTFVVSTPVTDIDGEHRLGYLQLVVRADLWAEGLRQTLARQPLEGFRVTLRDMAGYLLPLLPGDTSAAGGAPDRQVFSSSEIHPGWHLDLSVDRQALTSPVGTLVSTFAATGLVLLALILLLFLPSWQFLLKPLADLAGAAHRISAGDLAARVAYRSRDEVGQLCAAFNLMAEATEERTARLARLAEDLRRREAEIRRQRDRLDTVLHALEDGLFLLDRDGRVTLANPAAGELLRHLGAGRCGICAQCRNRVAADRDRPEPSSCLACLADFQRPVQPFEVTLGGRVYDLRGASLRDDSGEESERVFLSRDITEKRGQAARQAQQERLAVLGEIAAVVAHEMNNPLAAISMFSQMLLAGLDPDSPLRAHAEVVHRNTTSCKRIIRSLLDMATTSSSEPEDLDVRDVVDDVVELLRPLAERGRVVLGVDAEAGDGRVHARELALRQALINLVMNAIQAAGRGGAGEPGEVRVGTLDRRHEIVIRVRDSGPGIPAEIGERVFEPFFTTKPAGQGTGLGLPTTRRIAEAHGGRLSLRSSAPQGAIFELVLPRRAGGGVTAVAIAPRAAGGMS